MKVVGIGLLLSGLIAGCSTGMRDIDFINRQYEVSYNIDSTKGMDSARIAGLLNAKTVLNFLEGGQGTVHTQWGMVSKDSSFNWKLQEDQLVINDQSYTVEKLFKGYKLKSDAEMLIFRQQP
ncbi:hypothetical protein [Larkinella arboricola]|nr:hypothetical protein [Larkinella arboricola]